MFRILKQFLSRTKEKKMVKDLTKTEKEVRYRGGSRSVNIMFSLYEEAFFKKTK